MSKNHPSRSKSDSGNIHELGDMMTKIPGNSVSYSIISSASPLEAINLVHSMIDSTEKKKKRCFVISQEDAYEERAT